MNELAMTFVVSISRNYENRIIQLWFAIVPLAPE